MPELPEVETIKEALCRAFSGAEILSVEVRNRNFREKVPDNFEDILTHSKILRIYRRAKYAVLELNNGYSIIWHFGMSGRVKILRVQPDVPEKHDHIIIETDKGFLIFNDARRFGLMTLAQTLAIEQHPCFLRIGPDPFDEKLNTPYLLQKFRGKETPIKPALLDQSLICGIGNIYASEALYLARISPLRICSSLTSKEISRLIDSVRETLHKAIAAGGSTLRDYRKPDGSMGYFQQQHSVYGKEGQRCPACVCDKEKCGGIKKIAQGGRSTFYCPHLQK